MEIAFVVVLVAAGLGLLRGGSLVSLIETRFGFGWLVFVALGIQLYFVAAPPAWLTRASALAIFLTTQTAVLAFVAFNRRLPGIWLVGLGLFANMVVIAANQAMPVSQTAARIAGAEFITDDRHVEHGLHLRNEVMTEDSVLPWAADVIPVPVLHFVVSLGDLVIAAGLARLVYRRTKGTSSNVKVGREAATVSPVH